MDMSNHTLYLIQSNYANTESILTKLNSMITSDDSVVLMGDAVFFSQSVNTQICSNLYVLENDAENVPNIESVDFKIIGYDQFSDLILDYTRCVTLK